MSRKNTCSWHKIMYRHTYSYTQTEWQAVSSGYKEACESRTRQWASSTSATAMSFACKGAPSQRHDVLTHRSAERQVDGWACPDVGICSRVKLGDRSLAINRPAFCCHPRVLGPVDQNCRECSCRKEGRAPIRHCTHRKLQC